VASSKGFNEKFQLKGNKLKGTNHENTFVLAAKDMEVLRQK
jgi:hypothetical protein